MAEFDQIDISNTGQDKVIYLMIHDTTFLSRCYRKDLEPKLFSSEVRQKVVKIIYNFFIEFETAPNTDFLGLVADEITTGRLIHEEDEDMYIEYVDRLLGIKLSDINQKYLADQIHTFVKKRIVSSTLNSLQKLKDRFGVDPDRPTEMLREALAKIDMSMNAYPTESLRDESTYDFESDVVTKWMVDGIDRASGGGLKIGSFVVIQGYTNRGKSWAATHLAKMAARFGNTSLLAQIEMANKTSRMRLKMSISGHTERGVGENPQEVKDAIHVSLTRNSDIMLLGEDEKSMSVDALPDTVAEAEEQTGQKIRLIILDSADDMAPPAGKYNNRQAETTAIYTWLKNYAKDSDICIVTTTQAQRVGDTKYWLSTGNVGDDINKMRKATLAVTLNANDEEARVGMCRLAVIKNTDGPVGARSWIEQDYSTGQFVAEQGRYVKETYLIRLEEVKARFENEED